MKRISGQRKEHQNQKTGKDKIMNILKDLIMEVTKCKKVKQKDFN